YGDHLVCMRICKSHNRFRDCSIQAGSKTTGRMSTLTDYAWIFEDFGRNDVCTVRSVQEAQRYCRRQISQKPGERNRAPKEAEVGIENMLLHPWRHGVQLFFDVEKHKVNCVVSQMILQVRQ